MSDFPIQDMQMGDGCFGEDFCQCISFVLLLQVGISKEQGEGANFISTQVL